MALKLEITCSRCKRADSKSVSDLAAAQSFEERAARRVARLKEIQAFLDGIPKDELPDFMVVGASGSALHLDLCDPEGDEAKRSCKRRVNELLKQAQEFEPRKTRKQEA